MKARGPMLFVAILSLISLSCSSTSFVDLQSLKSEMHIAAFPGKKDYPDADAVVLSDVHDVYVSMNHDRGFETNVNVTKVIKLLRNVDQLASVELHVYSGETISGLKARTIEPDGSAIVLRKKEFHVITGAGNDYIFYSDEKKVRFTFPAVQRNCIIEYHYTVHESHPFIEDIWEIQGMYPVLRNIYRLTLPSVLLLSPVKGGYGWNWRYKVYNCDLGQPSYHQSPDENPDNVTVTLGWSKRNIPAFKPDPKMPPYMNYLQYVKFSPSDWKTWDDISGWYYRFLFKPQLDITPDISRKADELTQGCKGQSEKIERLFDFVQALRYAAIELGQDGYVPSKPETVLKRMYGDCKDKSILLISLLRSLGISAKPVLVLTSDEGTVDPGFPSWMFNHMIVKAETTTGKVYWLDPTVNDCALGEIPYQDEGTNALVLNDDNTSEIERIPGSTFAENAENISESVNIQESGRADIHVAMRFKGQENLETRQLAAEMGREDLMRFCKSLVAQRFLDATVDSCSLRNSGNVDKPLGLDFRMQVPDAVRKQGDMAILNVDPMRIREDWSWLSRDHRKYDIRFDYPKMITKTLEVSLPSGYTVDGLPRKVVLKGPGLYFSKHYMMSNEHRLDISESFAITSSDIDAGDYLQVKDFAEKVDASADKMILLRRIATSGSQPADK